MTHCFYIPPPPSSLRSNNPYLKTVASLPHPPPHSHAEASAQDLDTTSVKRNGSESSSDDNSSSTSPTASTFDPALRRRNSALSSHRNPRYDNPSNIRTRTLGFGPGVVIEREFLPQHPPCDEEVIIITVRLSNKFRKSSVAGAEDLPRRPPPRGFLRRLSTRMATSLDHSADKEERYKAIKMPRGEYKKYFQRDREGNYAGTEPEREWEEEDLMREYGVYQAMPLHSIVC